MSSRLLSKAIPYSAMTPAYFIAFAGYVGSIAWMVYISMTASKALPVYEFRGLLQYDRLMQTSRWIVSLENIAIIGVSVIALVLIVGVMIAIAMDQDLIGEGVFRTILLYPYAMSFIVTGIAWQWLLNPEYGIGAILHGLGLGFVDPDILNRPDRALIAVIIACVWQGTGLTVVIILSALRGVDRDLWNAARIEGIPGWQMYLFVVLPMIRPALYTAGFLQLLGVVSMYELVLALTGGGPGISTEVPTKFIMNNLFGRANIGLAAAACVTLLALIGMGGLIFLAMRRRVRG